MKKFIIAICGILVVSVASASEESTYGDSWKVTGTKNTYELIYNKGVENQLAPQLLDSRTIIAARKIYENGAEFCLIKTVGRSEQYSNYSPAYNNSLNMSYYIQKNPICKTICKVGFWGSECQNKVTPNTTCARDGDYETFFQSDMAELAKTNISKLQKVNDIQVFDEGTITLKGYSWDPDYNYSYSIMLGVVDFIDNGVVVAPYMITGNKSVKTNDTATTTLCVQGYVLGDNNTCKKPDGCKTINIKIGTGSGSNPSNSGNTNSTNDDDTASCGTGKDYERYGANTAGICLDCWEKGKNKIYSKIKKQCVNAHAYSKKKMQYGQGDESAEVQFQCWTLTDSGTYDVCVRGI